MSGSVPAPNELMISGKSNQRVVVGQIINTGFRMKHHPWSTIHPKINNYKNEHTGNN